MGIYRRVPVGTAGVARRRGSFRNVHYSLYRHEGSAILVSLELHQHPSLDDHTSN